MRSKMAVVLSALALAAGGANLAVSQMEGMSSGVSRDMERAIRYYDKGDDTEAMDNFMQILTRGDPNERNMANEYINLITQRMNMDGKAVNSPPPAIPTRAITVEPVGAPSEPSAPGTALSEERPIMPAPSAPRYDKAIMNKEIKAKVRNMVEEGLEAIKSKNGTKIITGDDGNPQAIAIPTDLFFESGIDFRSGADAVLRSLTKIVFALGNSQIVILPEGSALGETKILDMRRAMGISSSLYSSGIAPSRVRVNLLNTQVEIPRSLQEFKGIILSFTYNEPLRLNAPGTIGSEEGPPISIGSYPSIFRPDLGEGAVIEFSVQDPPAGITSWEFHLLAPQSKPEEGQDLVSLEHVMGGGPVFHQIYWNGRRNYFGDLLAPGRYECVLTATDGKNQRRTLHRWIQILGPAPSPPPARAAHAASVAVHAQGAPSADWPFDQTNTVASLININPRIHGVQIGGIKPQVEAKQALKLPKKIKHSIKTKKSIKAVTPKKEKKAESPAGHYVLNFAANTHQLAAESETLIGKISKDAMASPNAGITVTGYAASSEPNAAQIARSRAQLVVGLLINRYQIDSKRLQAVSNVLDGSAPKAEVDFSKTP